MLLPVLAEIGQAEAFRGLIFAAMVLVTIALQP